MSFEQGHSSEKVRTCPSTVSPAPPHLGHFRVPGEQPEVASSLNPPLQTPSRSQAATSQSPPCTHSHSSATALPPPPVSLEHQVGHAPRSAAPQSPSSTSEYGSGLHSVSYGNQPTAQLSLHAWVCARGMWVPHTLHLCSQLSLVHQLMLGAEHEATQTLEPEARGKQSTLSWVAS